MKTGFGAESSANCKHPESARSTLHGFGQRADDVREFFCRGCQRTINIDELERSRGVQSDEQMRADLLPDGR